MNVEFLSVSSPIESLEPHLSGLSEIEAQLEEIRIPEIVCGIYFLVDGKQVVYVGQTRNVVQRMYQHIREKQFCRILFVRAESQSLDQVERYWITKLDPPLNRLRLPEHPKPKKPKAHRVKGKNQKIRDEIIAQAAARQQPSILELDISSQLARWLFQKGISTIPQLERSSLRSWAEDSLSHWRKHHPA